MMISCGDIETNPGPNTPEHSFPCATCTENVSWNADALQCDGCDLWQHKDCIDISSQEYNRLGETSSCWICRECGLRNISTSLFSLENNQTTLSDNMNFSFGSITSPGEPMHASSPVKPCNRKPTRKDSLTILNTNCQSIRAKREPFHIMLNSINPDVVIGTESWLQSHDINSQIFPNQYIIERRDREIGTHGGVFIAVKTI